MHVVLVCGYRLKILRSVMSSIFKVAIVAILFSHCVNGDDSNETEKEQYLLSRRKRYLTFPDGSSFQLVFCVQTSALIPIGDIFLYGNTAALAWALPADPKFFHMFKNKNTAQRRGDLENVYYLDEKGEIVDKIPYYRKPFTSPVFAKRSINKQTSFKEKLRLKIDKLKMHRKRMDQDYLKKHKMDGERVQFHRNTRVNLYGKLESLLIALGQDGRQCILYKLCESAHDSTRQGTFQQELLRVVFTLPKGEEFEKDDHKEYDNASDKNHDCASLYPGCDVLITPSL